MEDFLADLVTSRTFTLPYLDDKSNNEKEVKAKASVTQGLQFIQSQQETLAGQTLNDAVLYLVLNLQVQPWNNRELASQAVSLLNELVGASSAQFSQFLSDNPKFCSKVNQLFSGNLRRDSWQDHAPLVNLYKWYCSHLKFPLVSKYLDVLLPPCLMLLDSYDDELKVSGVQCISCIMGECGKTELIWHGRAQVIFDVFEKLSYSHHEPLVVVLHPAVIQILKVLERDPGSSQWEKVDIVYHRLLSDMYLEDKLILRRTYALSLKQYILYLKSDVIKHLKLTMKVTLGYLEDSCGSAEITRTTMLEVIALLIKQARPRIERYFVEITKSLLRLVVDCAMLSISIDTQESITSHISEIFKLMMEREACTFIHGSLDLMINELPLQRDKKGLALLENLKEIQWQLS